MLRMTAFKIAVFAAADAALQHRRLGTAELQNSFCISRRRLA
jgi:hypothetical protein